MCSFHHTHTYTLAHYKYMCCWQWVGRMKRKKTADQYAEEKRWVFSSDLRDWRQSSDRERKRVPGHRSNVLKGSAPQGPPAHPGNTEYLRLSKESKESRDEATQRGVEELYQRQCGSRWELLNGVLFFLRPPFPHLHTPFHPFSPSLISLMVFVGVKHHVYLLFF